MVRHQIVDTKALVIEFAGRYTGHQIHRVDDVMDVLVSQRIFVNICTLWAFVSITVDVLLLRAEFFGAISQVAGSQVRDRCGAGETGDPVLHVAGNVFVGDVLANAIDDLLRAVVEAFVTTVFARVR